MFTAPLKLFTKRHHRSVVLPTVLATIFTTGFLLYLGYDSYLSEYGKAESEVQNISLVLEGQTESMIKRMDSLLLDMTDEIVSKGGYKKWKTDDLNHLAYVHAISAKEVNRIKFFDSTGHCVGADDSQITTNIVSDKEFFQAHKNNPNSGLVISKPVIGRYSGIFVIALSRRVEDLKGNFMGVAVLSLPVDFISLLYADLNLGSFGSIALLTLDGRYLLARFPFEESLFGRSAANDPLHKYISSHGVSDGVVTQISTWDGVQKIYGYRVLHDLGLVVVVAKAASEVLAAWKNRFETFAIMYILAAIGFYMLLYRYLYNQDLLEQQRVQLMKNAKMSALGEMAGSIAHEINNPLTIIKGRADQLAKILEKPAFDREKAFQMIQNIDKTTIRIANIIKGLRTFSRSGDSDPMSVSELTGIVAASLELCQEKFKHSSVELKVQAVPLVSISCRESQVSQVILNLLSNAFDAVAEKENPWVEISFKEYSKTIEIHVTDSGNGIPVELEEKIMTPFFTTKDVGKGTGLGLSISKGIIDSHQGKLFLNRRSQHTQFVISLPKLSVSEHSEAA